MASKIKMFTAVLIGFVLVLGCVVCAGCTSENQGSPVVPDNPKDTSASEIVGTWVEKITDDQYMVYNIKADGNAEMITYSISTGRTIISPTTWKSLGNHIYEIGNVRLTCDENNQWHMSHQNSGVFTASKYSSTITAHEHIVDVVSSVASKVDKVSGVLQQSISTAIAYASGSEPYSRAGLLKVLQDQNIDKSLEAVDKAGINWMKQAERATEKWTQRGENTESRLYAKLTNLGFTSEEVQHGIAYAKEKGLLRTT